MRGLILLNSFACVTPRPGLTLARAALAVVPWSIAQRCRGLVLRYVTANAVSSANLEPFERAVAQVEREDYCRRLSLLARFDVRRRLSEIGCPVLVLASDADRLLPSVREGRRMVSALRHGTLAVLPGSGHACLADPRVDLEARLVAWLRSGRAVETGG